MRYWLCSALLIVGCDELEPWSDMEASVPRMVEAPEDGATLDESAETACDVGSDCQRPLEPGIRALRERINENLMTTKDEAEIHEGKQLLAAIDAGVFATSAEIDAARPVCYSALIGAASHSLIMMPLPNASSNLDAACHISINSSWHAGGIAKGNNDNHDCTNALDNHAFGGGYTAYVSEAYFEANPAYFSMCGPNNAFVCCSRQFPN